MKRITALLICLALLLWGCGGNTADPAQTGDASTAPSSSVSAPTREQTVVGISLPDKEDPRWYAAGQSLSGHLENLGYQVMIGYAEGLARNQVEQMQNMIECGAGCIVVAAVDSVQLTQVAQTAKEQGVLLVAYDRLLMDTDWVAHYIAFDYYDMGVQMGQQIESAYSLVGSQDTRTIEFFMGSPEDHGAFLLHQGVMSVLRPYLDSGVLVCKTGRTAFEDCCFVDSSAADAQDYCRDYLEDYYTEAAPDILCTGADTLAQGCAAALEDAKVTGENWPYITGTGCEETALERIRDGKQAFTVRMDGESLAKGCAQVVDALLFDGDMPEKADGGSNNHVLDVPSYLLPFTLEDGQGES